MSTTKHCLDCGTRIDPRSLRCGACAARCRPTPPVTYTLPVGAPTLRDFPGQPALSGGYTSSELATLQALICTRGPWTPARWAWDTPVPRDTVA